MREVPPELDGHPDRLRWNIKYGERAGAGFAAHPLAVRALGRDLPAGPVLDLASGPSGAALLAAEAGRQVTAVDVSEVALGLLAAEAERRGLRDLLTCVQADLGRWRPEAGRYALVLCTGFWDRTVFAAATGAVAADGALAWEAFTAEARADRPSLPAEWCLASGEPADLLPPGFTVVAQEDVPGAGGARRRLLALRRR